MNPIIVKQSFNSPINKVWEVLSEESHLKKWYFNVENYHFEIGSEYSFYESADTKQFLHKCRFLNIIPHKLIEYTWTYPSHSKGSSVVKWEIQEKNGKTEVTISHSGTENFADGGEMFVRSNFEMGWTSIVQTLLRNYLYDIVTMKFDVEIDSTPAKVWSKLLEKKSYTDWTTPFCEGSYYEGELGLGKRIHFLSPSGEGMYSDIAYYKENEIVVFKHIGMMKDKKELPIDAETEVWTGCFETYKLKEKGGKTQLKGEVDTVKEYFTHMDTAFPLALKRLKEISEVN